MINVDDSNYADNSSDVMTLSASSPALRSKLTNTAYKNNPHVHLF